MYEVRPEGKKDFFLGQLNLFIETLLNYICKCPFLKCKLSVLEWLYQHTITGVYKDLLKRNLCTKLKTTKIISINQLIHRSGHKMETQWHPKFSLLFFGWVWGFLAIPLDMQSFIPKVQTKENSRQHHADVFTSLGIYCLWGTGGAWASKSQKASLTDREKYGFLGQRWGSLSLKTPSHICILGLKPSLSSVKKPC